MPRDMATDGIIRSAVGDTPLELITWDKVIPAVEDVELQSAFDKGCLALPAECPIATRQTIAGLPFGPLIVWEEFERVHISGIGLLHRKGIATEAPFKTLKDTLDKRLKPGATPKVLEMLITKIDAVSGIGNIFKRRRLIGGIDFFYRVPATTHLDGPLFDVASEKPDFRTKCSILRVTVRRHAAQLDNKVWLASHVRKLQRGAPLSAYAHRPWRA